MGKACILFKADVIEVHLWQNPCEKNTIKWYANIKTNLISIPLDKDATEVIVAYMKVIRSYSNCLPEIQLLSVELYQKLIVLLSRQLEESGKTIAEKENISRLITELGCVSDWQKQYYNSQ